MDLFVRPALEFFQATTIFFGLYLIYYTGTSLFKVFALKLFVNVNERLIIEVELITGT